MGRKGFGAGRAFVAELALGLELVEHFLVFEHDLADADFLLVLVELGEPAGRPAEPIDVVAGHPDRRRTKKVQVPASFGLAETSGFFSRSVHGRRRVLGKMSPRKALEARGANLTLGTWLRLPGVGGHSDRGGNSVV